MLAAHDAPDRPRVVQARAHRALHDIEHVGAALATRLEAVRAQGVARLAAVAAHEAQVSRDFARARRRVVDALEAFSAAYRRRAEAIGEELAGQIRAASKIPPDIVETTRARLVQAAETERETLRVSLSKTADGVAWRGKPSDLSFLQTGPIDFAIADNGLKATKAAPGVVIGGIIGLLGGPIGAAVGAAIGGALSGGAAAYEQDILDTCARLTEAASGAAGNINAAAQGGEVRLLDLCYSTRKPPAQLGSPDAADPAEIEQLITDLGYLAELIHEALGEDSANDGEATVIPATYGKAAP